MDKNLTDSVFPQHFPDNVTPFVNQVAGHEFTKKKPSIGMMKHKDGYVLKPVHLPVYGQREINFYTNLETTTDPVLKDLKQLVPLYLKTTTVELNGTNVPCICMEDITKDFKKPCVMDIKIGVQTWEPGSSERKIRAETAKYTACKKHWGFSIPGYQVYNVKTGEFERRDKDYGKCMTAEEAIKALYSFVNADLGIRYGLVSYILNELRKIQSWFRCQRQFLFFSSSILLAYDAEIFKLIERKTPNDQENVVGLLDESKIRVCMIDFAHVLPNLKEELDTNYVTSLERVIYVFDHLDELAASVST